MKTMANCSMSDFLKQSNKIRHAVAEYLDTTKVMDIRKNLPNVEGKTEAEKKQLLSEQGKKNLSDMVDLMLEKYPDETARLLGLLCFVETEEELDALNPFDVIETVLSERVLNFFTRLMKSGLIDTANTSSK